MKYQPTILVRTTDCCLVRERGQGRYFEVCTYCTLHLHDVLGEVASVRSRAEEEEAERDPVLVHVRNAELDVSLHELLAAEGQRLAPERVSGTRPPPVVVVVAWWPCPPPAPHFEQQTE